MNKRQKIFVSGTILFFVVAVSATVFFNHQNSTDPEKLKVVATFYPLAYFAKEIGGTQVIVKQLIPDNTEVHNWQPSTQDILQIEQADVLLYNGASLDHWFEEDILPIIDSSNKIIIETTEGTKLIETDHDENLGVSHSHNDGYDPHTWICPIVAKQQAENIYEALIQKDPDNTDYYADRWQNLLARFEEIGNRYQAELESKLKNEIFVSHSAFGYLADSYGFDQYGVIGISADEQPSASKYMNLLEMMLEHETYVVYVDPVYSEESGQTLKAELERLSGQDVQILKLYFMLGEMDDLDYFEQQEKNLENLKIGLKAGQES